MSALEALPGWVVRLVADLEYHEDVHPAGADHWCAQLILERVPADARSFARGWAASAATPPPERAEIEREVRRKICREEGCNLIESTRLNEADREFRCTRCGETRTQPREVKKVTS